MKLQVRGARTEEASVTLRRSSLELRKTIRMVEDMEQVVGLAIALSGKAEVDQMLELQKLDHLQQKILGVADFLDAVSHMMPADWMVDAKAASRSVLLAELGARLGDSEASHETPIPVPETYELF
jgi:hypothetical protein